LYDSLTSRRPDLLGISEDEGTVWLVQGDTAVIMGRNKAFVYNGRDPNDKGKPFLTLHPGDRYNLAARRLVSRAADATPLTQKFVDDVFSAYRDAGKGGARVVVAVDGKVLVNSAYGVPAQKLYMPETAVPNVPLAGLSSVLEANAQDNYGRVTDASIRRVLTIGGAQRLAYDSVTKQWSGNVDDLYRFEQGRTNLLSGARDTVTTVRGFTTDNAFGMRRQSVYGAANGHRSAWVRYPERRATIIVLTNDDAADAKDMESRIAAKLFGGGSK